MWMLTLLLPFWACIYIFVLKFLIGKNRISPLQGDPPSLTSCLVFPKVTPLALTSRRRYNKKAIPEHTMLSTWAGTLANKSSLPENWLQASRVLVGIPFHSISCYGIG